jgi:cholesterol oxidase
MLGASTVPFEAPADAVLRRVATQMGAGETYRPATVAVDFDRCIRCGGCMIGCRHGAKNTLDRNYLRLAEMQGARLLTAREVRRIRAVEGAWEAETARGSVSGAQVVLAAGVLGTLPLLFGLPRVPLRTGFGVRTNTETLVGATAGSSDTDYSEGVAIGSSFRPDDSSEIQAVRYPRGSNAMALLGRPLLLRHWAERTTILLLMGTGDDALRLVPRGRGLRSVRGAEDPPPVSAGAATTAVGLAAEITGGRAGRFRLDRAITAHVLGGACVGESGKEGVVDRYHRVFGQPGLHIVDGSTIGANLGVNPALTIAAQAERAMASWPRRGEPDERPAQRT